MPIGFVLLIGWQEARYTRPVSSGVRGMMVIMKDLTGTCKCMSLRYLEYDCEYW